MKMNRPYRTDSPYMTNSTAVMIPLPCALQFRHEYRQMLVRGSSVDRGEFQYPSLRTVPRIRRSHQKSVHQIANHSAKYLTVFILSLV
mmetsp:Transcript_3440/g.13099  ORF Transcript_3440/g.13099 Transcript_3440/m.13099 type:complete len:88 (-) Transcript_3440:3655-3918(-)